MSYLQYYGLEQEPFSNAPVSRFYFHSKQHDQALLRLRRVTDQMKGLAVLVGDIGAGKTTLARKMLDSLPESDYEAALLVIIHSSISAQWLLRRIAQQLGVQKPAETKLQILSQLYRRLLQIADSGKKAVVLIDEAQMLQTREIMEEFRGLLNLEIPDKKLITFIFFGLPEIEDTLKLDPPLQQRVAFKYRLDAFDSESTRRYIEHRLNLSGATRAIFDASAIDAIHQYSRGIPRLINTLADNALFEGFILKSETIRTEIIENIAVDLGLSVAQKRELRVVGSDQPVTVVDEVSFGNPLAEPPLIPEVELAEEKPAEQPFERSETPENEDIDSILAGLEEKL
ncbi:MAG TPA: AAA family ATPase [Bdellovibrionota bacterium]|nr:AAA family ATPase [Bdellovibrionota bacterium]